ncbi:hypothetical protein Q9966_015443 [Columba livia]|nr:hypothetical protein Q9966_015443 [Columba livia]
MRRAVPAEVRLALTLWRLGACTEYRAVEQQFGVSRSTVCKILRDVCEAVVANLAPAFAAPPAAAGGFALPQLAGVLARLRVPIRAPAEDAASYSAGRGWHAVELQAAVDARGCFWDVEVPPSTRGELPRPTAAKGIGSAGLYGCFMRSTLLRLFCSVITSLFQCGFLAVVAEGMAPPQRILFPPEKICMAWQHSQRAGAGLHNLGNTCFLNSVLQCLTYTPPLANHLLSGEHSRAYQYFWEHFLVHLLGIAQNLELI